MYTHGFLPAVYQPTMFRPGDRPVVNLDLPARDHDRPAAKDPAAHPRAERGDARSGRRGVLGADQRLRPGLQDADRGPGRPRPVARAAGDARPVRRRRRADPRLRPALPAGAEARRARRSIRLRRLGRRSGQPAVGRPRRHRGEPPPQGRRDRQAGRRLAQGPEAPGAARQHARPLGRRVRPLARGRVRQGARPPQHRLHHVDGRRRHQGRPGRRRHRRHRPPRDREARTTSATCTRRSCTSSASTSTG